MQEKFKCRDSFKTKIINSLQIQKYVEAAKNQNKYERIASLV